MKSLKRLFFIKNIPVYVEAGDETEAIILIETMMEAIQRDGYESLKEASTSSPDHFKQQKQINLNIN